MKYQTRAEQRQQHTTRQLLAIQLYCHLRNLIREIKAGDASKLPEFQQYVQFAPPEMKVKILEEIGCDDTTQTMC